MNLILGLGIGLLLGGLIGFLAARSKSNGIDTNNPLVDDLRRQLDAERNKTEATTKLNVELEAVKKTVENLTKAASDADFRRVKAETEIAEQVRFMAEHLSLIHI